VAGGDGRRKAKEKKMTTEKIYVGGIMAEIDPNSDTPRLREYFAHIENCGLAKKWDDLADLNITEDDFIDGPCHLGVDNAGTLVVFIRTRIPGDPYNDTYGWCRRPKLGVAHFNYSGCPEWLKQKFDHYWNLYGNALKDHYDAKEAAGSNRFAGFFD
jgi:hypothetical protein